MIPLRLRLPLPTVADPSRSLGLHPASPRLLGDLLGIPITRVTPKVTPAASLPSTCCVFQLTSAPWSRHPSLSMCFYMSIL